MLTSPTTSPYLSALQRAAVASRPSKQEHPSDGDFCFVCGNTTPADVAYCSNACRAQEEHPSPLLSPTATALPALVPSHGHRRAKKSGGHETSPLSSASSPLKTAEGEDDDEEDIENLVLPPPVASYGKKAPFNYAYTLATSPVASRSPVKSPVVRPSQAPSQALHKSPRALLPSTIQPSSPSANAETITFRRRHQPDSINGTKGAASALSPALLARRRLSNQQQLQSQSQTSGQGSTSKLQNKRASLPRRSPNFDLDLSLPSTSHRFCGPGTLNGLASTSRCVHVGCPISQAAQLASGYPALQRRVSEPHSPYASPRAVSPSEQNTFDRSFATRRPSLSTSATAPPVIRKFENKSQDYTGFAGFLAKIYREKPEVNQDGYEGQDEDHRENFRRALKKKNSSSREGLYMLSGRKPPKSPKVKPVESVKTAEGSSSSGSSAAPRETSRPGRFLFSRGQASGGKGSLAPAATSSEDDHEEKAHRIASAERPRHNHSASIGEPSRYVVSVRPEHRGRERPEQASNTALATSSSSSSDEAREEVSGRPESRSTVAQPPLKRTPSEVREQYNLHVEEQQERGRTSGRRPSTTHRAPVVSPFTALRNVTTAQTSEPPADKPVTLRRVSSPGESGRGRSRARVGAAYLQRSVSPNRSRSRASRSPKRVITT